MSLVEVLKEGKCPDCNKETRTNKAGDLKFCPPCNVGWRIIDETWGDVRRLEGAVPDKEQV